MKNKKWLIILIVAFPSMFWLILESSNINSRKLPYYGEKLLNKNGDTIYHKVSDLFYEKVNVDSSVNFKQEKINYPLYVIVFIDKKYRDDSYRLTGLWEYLNYKKQKIERIPFILVTEYENGKSQAHDELLKLGNHNNIHFFGLESLDFKFQIKDYFTKKPYYIDYSFFLLIDANRNIRGYYDARYVSEFKRLIEEYQHLRLKEEKQKLIDKNEIKINS